LRSIKHQEKEGKVVMTKATTKIKAKEARIKRSWSTDDMRTLKSMARKEPLAKMRKR
jgi:hypothetical protein